MGKIKTHPLTTPEEIYYRRKVRKNTLFNLLVVNITLTIGLYILMLLQCDWFVSLFK